jgi:hypothetical protein
VRSNALRSNATLEIERTQHCDAFAVERAPEDRTHAGVRSNAQPAFKRTPDLAARFILSIKKISLFSFIFTLGRRVEAPSVAQNLTVLHCKHS